MKYSSFTVNTKRLFNAIISKNPAAYLALIIKFAKPFTNIIDILINSANQNNNNSIDYKAPLVLLCASSRSGGTLIFQSLTRSIPSVYFTNLHALFPYKAHELINKKIFQSLDEKSFNLINYYGYTPHMLDVYEGNEFFKNLLNNDPINIQNKNIIQEQINKLYTYLHPQFPQCIIIKNVAIYRHIYLLAETIPYSVFIYIKRDLVDTIESSLQAYKKLGYFNPIPPSLEKIPVNKNPLHFAVKQVLEVQKIIDRQLKIIPEERKMEIPYENFCNNPYYYINYLSDNLLKIPHSYVKDIPALSLLKPSTRVKASEVEKREIIRLLSKFQT